MAVEDAAPSTGDHPAEAEAAEPQSSPAEVKTTDGDGDCGADATPSSPHSALLRAERSCVFEERLESATKLRLAGNEELKEGRVMRAIALYRRAIDYHADIDEAQRFELLPKHEDMLRDVQLPIHLNLAQALLKGEGDKLALAREAAEHAKSAAELCPDNPKAQYWLSRAALDCGDVDTAETAITEAARLAPADPKVTQLRKQLAELRRRDKRREQQLYRKLAAGLKQDSAPLPDADAEGGAAGRLWGLLPARGLRYAFAAGAGALCAVLYNRLYMQPAGASEV